MSYAIAVPQALASAASDVASIGSSLNEANVAAAAPTTAVVADGDEVWAAIASPLSSNGQDYRALSAQAAAFHA
jgi:PE family